MYYIVIIVIIAVIYVHFLLKEERDRMNEEHKVHLVRIRKQRFVPQHVYMKPYEKIKFRNDTHVRHAIINMTTHLPNSPLLLPNDEYVVQLKKPQELSFRSVLYPKMRPLLVTVDV